MILILHITAIILKSLHTFFDGARIQWFLLVINRNTIILFLALASYLLLKALYSRCMQFNKHIDVKVKNIHSDFLFNLKRIVNLSRLAFEFWLVSFIFSNTDLILSYFKIQIFAILLIAELIPYIYIFIRANKEIIKWLRGL